MINWLIDWYLAPTLAVVQLYRGVNKFYKEISTFTRLFFVFVFVLIFPILFLVLILWLNLQ